MIVPVGPERIGRLISDNVRSVELLQTLTSMPRVRGSVELN